MLYNQKNGPYSTDEIEPVLREVLRGAGNSYQGLLMGSDSVPATPPGGTYLINLDSRSGGGTHWGILRRSVQRPSTYLWLDSLGLMPPRPITHSVWGSGLTIIANDAGDQRITNAKDALCGPRAAIYAEALAAEPKKDYATFMRICR